MAQTDSEWQLVLIDDASTDNSVERIEGLLSDPRIRVLKNDTNRGQAETLNRGLAEVTTPYFLGLDADDWLAPNAVERFLAAAEKVEEEVGLIVSSVVVFDEDAEDSRPVRQAKWGKSYKNRYQVLLANLFPWQKFYRTDALREIGGWPPDPNARWRNVEDLAIFLRLIEKYKIHWVDELLYYYRIHSSNITSDRAKTAAGVEYLIKDALERWGAEYEAVFIDTPDGWRVLGGLLSAPINAD
jgi:glycosyltransferase involved in cell wall biosynthesis